MSKQTVTIAQKYHRYAFICISLLLLLTQGITANAANIPWWDTNYNLRREITVTTGATDPFNGYNGYTVRDTNFNSASLITAGTLQSDCDDLRVVRWDGSAWTEIDRHLLDCNTANTDVRFKLVANIAANSSDVSYYYYYDNSGANAANTLDTTNVYAWYDDASTNRLGNYTLGRGDNWHGTGGTNSISHNGSAYSFNTGDNFTNSMRRAVNERDVYIEAEMFHTNAFPIDMTTGLITRYQLASGSGSNESASHYYATNRADSPFQNDAGYAHDVSIMKDNRGTIAIGPADGASAPVIAGNQWRRQALAIWDVNNTNGTFWDNDDTAALGPSGWPSSAPIKNGVDSGTDYEGSGDAGLIIAQDAGQIRNILIRRYVAAEPVLSLATQESQLIAYYAQDEASWNGSSGEVIDQSVNAYHAQAINGAFTDITDPAITGDPGTCRYGNFDGNNDYLALPSAFPNLQGSFTITAWINTNNRNDRGQRVLADDENNSGGYSLSLGDPGAGRLRFFSRAVSPVSLDTGVQINNNQWYFVSAVHNVDAKTRQIYVDGVLAASGTYSGNWGTDTGIASIGGETNNAGENNNNFRFDGEIDEVRVYSQALSSTDINIVMALRHPCGISSGVTCGPIPSTYPAYSAGGDLNIEDDVEINVGGSNINVEEGDNNGNAIDVTGTVGDVITVSETLPTIDPETFPSNSSTENQTVDNNNSPFTFDSTVNDTYNIITIEDNTTANFIGGGPFYIDTLIIEDDATVNFDAGNYFINNLTIGQNSSIIITSEIVNIYINNEFEVDGEDVSINASGNVGGLVVYLYDNAEFKGDEELAFTGVIYGPNSGEIEFGEETNFRGVVVGGDEVSFDEDSIITYTPADAAIVSSISTCMAMLDHYSISHAGTGVTCLPTEITIVAHDQAHAPTLPAAGTTISLSSFNGTSALGSWTSVVTGAGTLTDSTLGDGAATYVFNGAESSVVLNFDYPLLANANSDTVTINIADGGLSEQEDPNLIISLAAFIIDNVPTQLSGKPSDTGFNATTINIQAVRASPVDSSVCVPAFPSGQSRTIELGAECLDPSTCAGNQVSVNSTNIATNNDNAGAALTSSYTGVSLNFGANAIASLILNYPDAGQMQLHARYNIPLANGNPSGEFMVGSTNEYVVRPLALRIPMITGNNAATTSAGAASFTAGINFNFNLEGVVWQQTDDADNDGVADGFNDDDPDTNPANILDNASTPNFNASASLSTTLVAPAGGDNPSLSSTSAAITNGSGTATTSWPEVGIIEINASVTDYLTTGGNVLGRSSYIGRFIPDRFIASVNSPPTLADSCGTFSYMDQAISFTSNPVITLTAFEEGGDETINYDRGGFWKYAGDLSGRSYSNNATTPATLDAPALGSVAISGDTDSNATGDITISDDTLMYQRPADPRDTAGGGVNPAIPFTADIDLNLTAADLTDTDGVCYDSNNDGTCETYSVSNIVGTQLRFGRLDVGNAFGSELVNLQLPITAQYYASIANDFIASAGDTCTTLNITPIGPPNWGHINLSSYQGSLSAGETTPTLSAFSNGAATLTLSAPGLGNQGSVVITPLLMDGVLAEQAWLQFDWDNDGSHDNNPTATATFGIFRGNDSTIYLRELY